MTPLIRSCPFLCDLCDLRVDGLFGSDLHTEIAKVAKTNSDWTALRFVIVHSFGIFAISVWMVFSHRIYTQRSQSQFGLMIPFDL
jgi:hypothetical protein